EESARVEGEFESEGAPGEPEAAAVVEAAAEPAVVAVAEGLVESVPAEPEPAEAAVVTPEPVTPKPVSVVRVEPAARPAAESAPMPMVALETGFVGMDVDNPESDESAAAGVADGEAVVDQTAEGEDEAAADAKAAGPRQRRRCPKK